MPKEYLTRQDLKVVSFGMPERPGAIPNDVHILPHVGIPGAKGIIPLPPAEAEVKVELPPAGNGRISSIEALHYGVNYSLCYTLYNMPLQPPFLAFLSGKGWSFKRSILGTRQLAGGYIGVDKWDYYNLVLNAIMTARAVTGHRKDAYPSIEGVRPDDNWLIERPEIHSDLEELTFSYHIPPWENVANYIVEVFRSKKMAEAKTVWWMQGGNPPATRREVRAVVAELNARRFTCEELRRLKPVEFPLAPARPAPAPPPAATPPSVGLETRGAAMARAKAKEVLAPLVPPAVEIPEAPAPVKIVIPPGLVPAKIVPPVVPPKRIPLALIIGGGIALLILSQMFRKKD